MAATCSCCGQPVSHEADPLVAAADLLVIRALELVGKRIVHTDRRTRGERAQRLADEGLAWHEAHTLWPADEDVVEKGLAVAWDPVALVLVEHGCCGATPDQITLLLDRYARDLLLTQTPHRVGELRLRLAAYLGVEVPA